MQPTSLAAFAIRCQVPQTACPSVESGVLTDGFHGASVHEAYRIREHRPPRDRAISSGSGVPLRAPDGPIQHHPPRFTPRWMASWRAGLAIRVRPHGDIDNAVAQSGQKKATPSFPEGQSGEGRGGGTTQSVSGCLCPSWRPMPGRGHGRGMVARVWPCGRVTVSHSPNPAPQRVIPARAAAPRKSRRVRPGDQVRAAPRRRSPRWAGPASSARPGHPCYTLARPSARSSDRIERQPSKLMVAGSNPAGRAQGFCGVRRRSKIRHRQVQIPVEGDGTTACAGPGW
jgi:hypothetical protein